MDFIGNIAQQTTIDVISACITALILLWFRSKKEAFMAFIGKTISAIQKILNADPRKFFRFIAITCIAYILNDLVTSKSPITRADVLEMIIFSIGLVAAIFVKSPNNEKES